MSPYVKLNKLLSLYINYMYDIFYIIQLEIQIEIKPLQNEF